MKYIVLLCDGMADWPLPSLGGETPMSRARKPHMDALAARGILGMAQTVPDGLPPGSDVANLSVMGYDPRRDYSGRSPLEAVSMGIPLAADDLALRCNLVTLSDEDDYARKRMTDYCAGDISSAEAGQIIEAVQEAFGGGDFDFYPGISYRHCLVWHGGAKTLGTLTPPHDISDRHIGEYLPAGEAAAPLLAMMERSVALLRDHPVNRERIRTGKRPANAIWLWGQGTRPNLAPFTEKFGKKGSVVSAVDLMKGIGQCARMSVVDVPGATGYLDTNFEGKAQAALSELSRGQDLVYIHIEAPDECGHRGEVEGKIEAIELIDRRVLSPLLTGLRSYDAYRVMILPDHPTPLALKTHTSDPVPFLMYDSTREGTARKDLCFTEASAAETGLFVRAGHTLMASFVSGDLF